MKVIYDGADNVLSIELRDAPVMETEELRPGHFADLDRDGRILGLQVLNASELIEEPGVIQVEQRSG